MKLCSITSGSSGNCIFVGSENTTLLVDVGISGKKIEEGLQTFGRTGRDVDGILITHEHSDHIKSVGVMARRHNIPIYASKGTIESMLEMKNLGKIEKELFHCVESDHVRIIGDIEVDPFTIPHDAAQPLGYKFRQGKKSVAIATDMGDYNSYIVEKLQGLDAILLEANHDVHMLQVGGYPYYLKRRILSEVGHLSNEVSGRLLCELLHDNMQRIFLGHLSKENNYEALAFETVCNEVTLGDNPYKSSDFAISVAHRDQVSELIEI